MEWRQSLEREWGKLSFGEVKVATDAGRHTFEVHVYLNSLSPDAVRVELYADGLSEDVVVRQEMERVHEPSGADTTYLYRAEVSAERPASDYTPRVVSSYPGAAVPLEAGQILWQR